MLQSGVFLISILIEAMILKLICARFLKEDQPAKARIIVASIVATFITCPCAWALNSFILADLPFGLRASIIECLVILGEAIILFEALCLKGIHALLFSTTANGIAFFMALLFFGSYKIATS